MPFAPEIRRMVEQLLTDESRCGVARRGQIRKLVTLDVGIVEAVREVEIVTPGDVTPSSFEQCRQGDRLN